MLRILNRFCLFSTALIVVLFPCSISLYAQATGRIGGTVTDSSNAVLVRANIACKNLDTGIVRKAVSNELGIFEFPDLPIGKYEVEASQQGFQSVKADVSLLTGQVVDPRLTLNVGGVTQAVTVAELVPLVQEQASSIQTSVTETQMKDLPLNG